DELGLLPPATRVSGQRRYRPEAVARVGVILLLTDVGFTLAEVGMLLASDYSSYMTGEVVAVSSQRA
ncbi:MAG TPA: MerR family transcriptional regulator, partial [Acidimicrobiales bacterium]